MTRLVLALCTAVALTTAACDTGDGTTLRPPDQPFVPATTVPAPADGDTAIDQNGLDQNGIDQDGLDQDGIDELEAGASTDFTVFAPWVDGGPINPLYACDGGDVSPAVSWSAPPIGTVELAVALVDLSAFDDAGRPVAHWAVGRISTDAITLFEGEAPEGTVSGANFTGAAGYAGPCPPEGDGLHQYRLTVYALNQSPELADGLTAAEMISVFESSSIAAADIFGVYER